MTRVLNKLYPNGETSKEIIVTSLLFGFLLYILLIIYQPFGTSQFEHIYKYFLLFPYAGISASSFCCINLLLSKQKREWTVGLELSKIFLILLLISSLSYFYNSFFLSKVSLSFENYLYMFAYTSALGVPVGAIYFLSRYIYLIEKDKPFAGKIVSDRKLAFDSKNTIEKNNKNIELHIVADDENFDMKIEHKNFLYAESADNYCIIHFYRDGMLQRQIIRISLTKLLFQIQTEAIKKVHRSFIVNLRKVDRFKGNTSGYKILIENVEKEIAISRSYIDEVVPLLKNFAIRP